MVATLRASVMPVTLLSPSKVKGQVPVSGLTRLIALPKASRVYEVEYPLKSACAVM